MKKQPEYEQFKLTSVTYGLYPWCIEIKPVWNAAHTKVQSYSIYLLEHGMQSCHSKLPDGTHVVSGQKTWVRAYQEMQRISRVLTAPLTRREIKHHFTLKWMRTEEQAAHLEAFRNCLLEGKYDQANKVYDKMSGYTKEAIPARVQYILEHHQRNKKKVKLVCTES